MVSLDSYKPRFSQITEHFKEELGRLRTGRANPSILDNIFVEAYGSSMPLKGVASITIVDPKTISIEPWDKTLLKEVEKAIQLGDLGINPVNDGKIIRLTMPPMTEEFRHDLVRVVGQRLEQERVTLRQLRDEIREEIFESEKNKEISEDQRFQTQEKLDKMTKDLNDTFKQIAEEKEKEIMTI